MNCTSRIPTLSEVSFDGALLWFAEMQAHNMLFHPEDDPADVVPIKDDSPMFSDIEADVARQILATLEASIGHDAVCEAAYPIFMNALGIQLDA